MRYLENQWNDKDIGLQDVPVLAQARASEEAIGTIDATIAAHVAGKATVIGPFDADGKIKVFGNDIAGTGKARERISYKDKDNPKKILYRYEEVPATGKHILTATLSARDERGSVESMEGDLVEPWVHLVYEDGSQVDLLAIPGKKTKAPKDKDA